MIRKTTANACIYGLSAGREISTSGFLGGFDLIAFDLRLAKAWPSLKLELVSSMARNTEDATHRVPELTWYRANPAGEGTVRMRSLSEENIMVATFDNSLAGAGEVNRPKMSALSKDIFPGLYRRMLFVGSDRLVDENSESSKAKQAAKAKPRRTLIRSQDGLGTRLQIQGAYVNNFVMTGC